MTTERTHAEKLEAAGCRFYHGINLRAFSMYCKRGAILSREQLKAQDPGYTPFWSDPDDEQRGVMSRVFGNLYDFGAIFARARMDGSPNVYGPITLVMSPSTFGGMQDIIITKRSIVSLTGDWRDHALDAGGIDALLVGDEYGSPIAPGYQYSEISCGNNAVPLATLEQVIVDPLELDGVSLLAEVQQMVKDAALSVPVVPRRYGNGEHLNLLQGLTNSLYAFQHSAEGARQLKFQDVPDLIAKMDKRYQPRFEIWAGYFYFDTICFVRDQGK